MTDDWSEIKPEDVPGTANIFRRLWEGAELRFALDHLAEDSELKAVLVEATRDTPDGGEVSTEAMHELLRVVRGRSNSDNDELRTYICHMFARVIRDLIVSARATDFECWRKNDDDNKDVN